MSYRVRSKPFRLASRFHNNICENQWKHVELEFYIEIADYEAKLYMKSSKPGKEQKTLIAGFA